MTTPDPQTVREIAEAAIRKAYEGSLVARVVGELGARGTWNAEMQAAVLAAADAVVLSWPAEQQDGAAGRVATFLDAWDGRPGGARPDCIQYVFNGPATAEPQAWLAKTDLRTVLAERDVLAARVAELEAHPARLLRADREADEADVRAASALLDAQANGASMAECKHAFAEVRARFADRIAALNADPDGGAE